MADERREFQGGAVVTTITGAINSTATTITIADATGWPSGGANGKFYAELDFDTASAEKILVQSRSGTTLTLASSSDRGKDGTTGVDHAAGAQIRHVFTAHDADEANYWANQLAKGTTAGDTTYYSANRTLARRAVGTDEQVFKVSGGLPVWGQVDTDGITDGAVEDAKIGANQLLEAKHATGLRHVYVQAAQPGSPFNGQPWFDTDNGQVRVYYGVTGFQKLWDVAWGYVGRDVDTSGTTGLTSGTSADLLGLAVTFTAIANRRYKVSAQVRTDLTSSTTSIATIQIADGSNVILQESSYDTSEATTITHTPWVDTAPSAGSTTYKLRYLVTGGGTLSVIAGATRPAVILVEDIGPAADPTLV